jgi:hypothetical protein
MTLRPFNGRDPHASRRVSVHKNLHREEWAVKALEGPHKGTVVAYTDRVGLTGAVMHVGEKARLKIAAGAARSVHAWVIGTLADVTLTTPCRISYRPHERPEFFRVDDGRAVWHAPSVLFTDAAYIES